MSNSTHSFSITHGGEWSASHVMKAYGGVDDKLHSSFSITHGGEWSASHVMKTYGGVNVKLHSF